MNRVDLLVAKQGEIDELRGVLHAEREQAGQQALQYVYRAELLTEVGELLRRVMEVPEAWSAVPEIGSLLTRIREETANG